MEGEALAFRAIDLRGDGVIDLAEVDAEVIVVDFWASWCGPCRRSAPFYERLYQRYGSSGLAVVGLSIDDERALAERFVSEVPTTFPMAWDEGQRIAARVGVETMPTALVLDGARVIREVHAGFEADDEIALERLVTKLLERR